MEQETNRTLLAFIRWLYDTYTEDWCIALEEQAREALRSPHCQGETLKALKALLDFAKERSRRAPDEWVSLRRPRWMNNS